MREIKFRGMSHNGWLYGDLIHNRGKVYIAPIGEIYHESVPEDFEVDENSISQFTGLCDKNNKEIYEGDIVRASINFHGKERKIKYEVKFDDDIDNDSFGEPLTMGYCLIGYDFEVIGNIYDNKDLMKEEKERKDTNEYANAKSWHEIFMADADEYSKQLKDKNRDERRRDL